MVGSGDSDPWAETAPFSWGNQKKEVNISNYKHNYTSTHTSRKFKYCKVDYRKKNGSFCPLSILEGDISSLRPLILTAHIEENQLK